MGDEKHRRGQFLVEEEENTMFHDSLPDHFQQDMKFEAWSDIWQLPTNGIDERDRKRDWIIKE